MPFMQITHGGHKGGACLARELGAQVFNGVDNFH
jgi:hypothetical protein